MFKKYYPPFHLPKKMYRKKVEELTKANDLLRVQLDWMKKEMARKNDELAKAKNRTKIIAALLEAEIEKVGGKVVFKSIKLSLRFCN